MTPGRPRPLSTEYAGGRPPAHNHEAPTHGFRRVRPNLTADAFRGRVGVSRPCRRRPGGGGPGGLRYRARDKSRAWRKARPGPSLGCVPRLPLAAAAAARRRGGGDVDGTALPQSPGRGPGPLRVSVPVRRAGQSPGPEATRSHVDSQAGPWDGRNAGWRGWRRPRPRSAALESPAGERRRAPVTTEGRPSLTPFRNTVTDLTPILLVW